MKKYPILQIGIYILCLSAFQNCREAEDTKITPAAPPFADTFSSTDTTNDAWTPVSEDYIIELINLEVPPLNLWIDDPELEQKYRHAILLKEHGDIPQVRTIIAFELNIKPEVPITVTIPYLDREIAYLEAAMFISPNADTQKTLENSKKLKLQLTAEMNELEANQLIAEDPKLFVELQRISLIESFGNIPEVHTYTTVLLKILLEEPVTKEEIEAFEQAKSTLYPDEL